MEEGLPSPSYGPGTANETIKHHKVCFYHARGDEGRHQQQGNDCRFSHDDTVLPFAHYPQNEAVALSELTRCEMEQAYGADTVQPAKGLDPDQES